MRSHIQSLQFQEELCLRLNLNLHLNLWVDSSPSFRLFLACMGIVCCIANSCFLDVLPNVIILYIAHINCVVDSCFLCAITVQTQKGNTPDEYSASKELLFARALEHNLPFLVPSRGGTFILFCFIFSSPQSVIYKRREHPGEDGVVFSQPSVSLAALLPAQGFEPPPC